MNHVRILQGDCLTVLPTLESESVHCCVTSPPYFGLRDYGTAMWEGGSAECEHLNRHGMQGADGDRAGRSFVGAQNYYRETCGLCGATRVDQQIGLEPTPEAFVAKLVSVFREVRRVLRADGTLWLNLGDSYAASGKDRTEAQATANSTLNGSKQTQGGVLRQQNKVVSGLKAKDLIGIPWMMARALRDPYYSGDIARVEDRIWLAAMLDAEGCMFIHKRKAGQSNGQGYVRQNDTYSPGVEICNTSSAVVERIMQLVGKGSISTSEKGRYGRKQTLYRWNLRTTESRKFVQEIYPYLIAKQHQARIMSGCPTSGVMADASHVALIGLHNGVETTLDFPAPASLFEHGYYLRQDLIWSKPNPMPESVADRCTKAHEYIFLLSKSDRYYFDAKAIAEKAAYAGQGRGGSMNRYEQNAAGMDNKVYDTRNKRSVWTVKPASFDGAHFATFPPALIEPCILAGCPEGGTVLDPFGGSGTTGQVALAKGRKAVLIELNPEYIELIRRRTDDALCRGPGSLFAEVP